MGRGVGSLMPERPPLRRVLFSACVCVWCDGPPLALQGPRAVMCVLLVLGTWPITSTSNCPMHRVPHLSTSIPAPHTHKDYSSPDPAVYARNPGRGGGGKRRFHTKSYNATFPPCWHVRMYVRPFILSAAPKHQRQNTHREMVGNPNPNPI